MLHSPLPICSLSEGGREKEREKERERGREGGREREREREREKDRLQEMLREGSREGGREDGLELWSAVDKKAQLAALHRPDCETLTMWKRVGKEHGHNLRPALWSGTGSSGPSQWSTSQLALKYTSSH